MKIFQGLRPSLFLLPIAVAFFAAALVAQCPPPGTIFTNQAQVDAMASQYPNCRIFEGNLVIQEAQAGSIRQLNGLRNIQELDGDLVIRLNRDLQSLGGLSALARISGELNIQSNGQLQNLNGLGGLTYVGSQAMILSNPALRNLDGLRNLRQVNGSFFLRKNPSLSSISGLGSLQGLAGDLIISENPSLESLAGLQSLQQLGHSQRAQLSLTDNPRLNDISALAALDFTQLTYLEITKCPSLSTAGRSSQATVLCSYVSGVGSARIYGNGSGFDSLETLRQACK